MLNLHSFSKGGDKAFASPPLQFLLRRQRFIYNEKNQNSITQPYQKIFQITNQCKEILTKPSEDFIYKFLFQTIGIDSEFCIVESLVTGIVDMWPDYLRPRRRQFTTAICILLFILGVPMVTNGGAYIFQVRIEIALLNSDQ